MCVLWISIVCLLATTLAATSDVVPILIVSPHCGSTVSDDAWVDVKSDHPVAATIFCKHGVAVPFVSSNGVDFKVPFHYTGATSKRCVFNKKTASQVYTAKVRVSWGETGSLIHTMEKRYQITCTFSDKDSIQTSNHNMDAPLVAPKEIQNHEGTSSSSSMTVQLTDVLGRPFQGPVRIGRKVQLLATSDGAGSEWGIRPDGCNIVGMNSGTSYAILRAGCGDGLVFGKHQGFNTVNFTSTSPPFKLISLISDTSIKFSCNFTFCTQLCNENSCSVERKRRDITHSQVVIVSHTIPILGSIALVSTPYIDTTTPGPLNKDSQYSITVPPLVIESSEIHKSNTSLYNAQENNAIETDTKPLLSTSDHQLKTTSYDAPKTVAIDPNAKPLSSHVLRIDDNVDNVNNSSFHGSHTKPKNRTSAYSIDKYFSLPLSEQSKNVLSEVSLSQPSYPMLARLPLGGYAFDLQSVWPLWVGVLLAIAMCSTLILAAVFLSRRRSDSRSDDSDNHDEYDSLLKE